MRQAVANEHGKIQKALWVIDSFPEEVEADLQRYYGIDLAAIGRGLSWRKFLVLVNYLPPEGALSTAIRNATPADMLAASSGDSSQSPWSTLELLAAALIDEVRQLSWMYASAHSETKIQKPVPISRPGSGRARGKRMSIAEAKLLDPRLRNLDDDEIRERMAGRL